MELKRNPLIIYIPAQPEKRPAADGGNRDNGGADEMGF
jgi:hypothetical protein